MARRSTPADGRITWRRALLGAGAGIAGYVLAAIIVPALLDRFHVNPYNPGAWTVGAVFVGILAVAVVLVLGVAPGLSRRRARRIADAAQPGPAPTDRPAGR